MTMSNRSNTAGALAGSCAGGTSTSTPDPLERPDRGEWPKFKRDLAQTGAVNLSSLLCFSLDLPDSIPEC